MQKILIVVLYLFSSYAFATQQAEQGLVDIDGIPRPFHRLYDARGDTTAPIILLLSGSGCDDFGSRIGRYFSDYKDSIDVYHLEKPGIEKNSDGSRCTQKFHDGDSLEQRLNDHLKFIEALPALRGRPDRSIAVLGFSEGGQVAPLIAARSKKIGWLITVGSGGMAQSEEFLVFARRGVAPYAKPFSERIFLEKYEDIKKNKSSTTKTFFGQTYQYWASHLFHDPLPVFAKLEIPIVVAIGEGDESVPVESGRLLRDFFQTQSKANLKYVEYQGANHGLRTASKNYLNMFIADLPRWFRGNMDVFNSR